MLPAVIGQHIRNVAFYLTFDCNLRCSYCINHQGAGRESLPANPPQMTPEQWIMAANRFNSEDSPPIVLQGGEPMLCPGLYQILRETENRVKFEIKTNLTIDENWFIREVPPEKFARAGIIVSYHPEQAEFFRILDRIQNLRSYGFRVGLYAVNHPLYDTHLRWAQKIAIEHGIELHLKEFVGEWRGQFCGTLRYPDAVSGKRLRTVRCRTCEVLVGPGGQVYRCYADLFDGKPPIGHILDRYFDEATIATWRTCNQYGRCSPCNIKVKNDPIQGFQDYSSVEIEFLEESP